MIWYNDIYLEDLGLYLKANPMNAVGFMPEMSEAVYEGDRIDGEYHQGADYVARKFSLDFVLVADSTEELEQRLEQVRSILWQSEPKSLTYEGLVNRQLFCMINGAVSGANTPLHRELSVSFIAPNPLWQSLLKETQALAIGPDILCVGGNHPTPFRLRIDGPVTDLIVTINGQSMTRSGAIGQGDVLIIDTGLRTATYNGINAKFFNRVFPLLNPGENSISVSGGIAFIEWFNSWL